MAQVSGPAREETNVSCFYWPGRLSARMAPFHGAERSSILLRATIFRCQQAHDAEERHKVDASLMVVESE